MDFIHASPPCQRYSRMSNCRPGVAEQYPELITPVRELLNDTGLPWVIENVTGARDFVKDPMVLCGIIFGWESWLDDPATLAPGQCYRHRLFEAGGGLTLDLPPMVPPELAGRRNKECGWPHPVPTARAGHWEPGRFPSVSGHERVTVTRPVMGIDWTNREELAEAIPPYFTKWIGDQL